MKRRGLVEWRDRNTTGARCGSSPRLKGKRRYERLRRAIVAGERALARVVRTDGTPRCDKILRQLVQRART